jgi:hypothetical protein
LKKKAEASSPSSTPTEPRTAFVTTIKERTGSGGIVIVGVGIAAAATAPARRDD